jgi:hypothetical protein
VKVPPRSIQKSQSCDEVFAGMALSGATRAALCPPCRGQYKPARLDAENYVVTP